MRTCDICGTGFEPNTPNKLRCSKKCVAAYRLRWMNSHHVKAPMRMGSCLICSNPVQLKPKSRSMVTCSPTCTAISRKAIRQRFQATEKYKIGQKKFSQTAKGKANHKRWQVKRGKQWLADRMANNPSLRVARNLSVRLHATLRVAGSKTRKGNSTVSYIGCTPDELRTHLEKQFRPGMNWQTYGRTGWHIDHIRPMVSFEFVSPDGAINEEEIRRAMHYTNLQPLWYWENISKGGKLIAL